MYYYLFKQPRHLFVLLLLLPAHNLFAFYASNQKTIRNSTHKVTYSIDSLSRPQLVLLVKGYTSTHNLPKHTCDLIRYFTSVNHDLSGDNLSGLNFTGYDFSQTIFTNTVLEGVILKDTTCKYQKYYKRNIIVNNIDEKNWSLSLANINLYEQLSKIEAIYFFLDQPPHYKYRATLLQIASSLSLLPFYKGIEFDIKFTYWVSRFKLLLKKSKMTWVMQGNSLIKKLDAKVKNYCWESSYNPNSADMMCKISLPENFNEYMNSLAVGWNIFASTNSSDKTIIKHLYKSLQGLKSASNHIEKDFLKQEALFIGRLLSGSFKFGGWELFTHFHTCQYRLIRLKKWVNEKAKKAIYCDSLSNFARDFDLRRKKNRIQIPCQMKIYRKIKDPALDILYEV